MLVDYALSLAGEYCLIAGLLAGASVAEHYRHCRQLPPMKELCETLKQTFCFPLVLYEEYVRYIPATVDKADKED